MTDKLNQKIKSSFDKDQDRVLVSGMYAHNATSGKFNYCNVDDNGDLKVNIHATGGGGDMKARTDPNDSATSVFLKANSNNHLKTQLVGFDGSEFRDIKCNPNGELEMTAELSTSGLATSAIQTDGTQKTQILGNTSSDGSGSQRHLLTDVQGHLQVDVLNQNQEAQLAGFTNINDVSSVKRCLVDSDGHLQVDVLSGGSSQVIAQAEDDTGSARNLRCNNSGHQKSQLIANTVGDGSGTNKVVHCNDAGQLKTQLIGEDNTATRRAVRTNTVGHIQTATLANTAGDGSGTIKNVVCDSDGHLQIDVINKADVNVNRDEITVPQLSQGILNGSAFTSTSVDLRGFSKVEFFGTSTNTQDPIDFEISADDTTFYKSGTSIFQHLSSGDFQFTYEGGARYIRILQDSSQLNSAFTISCISSKK
jgi:hypothetical protein